MLYVGRQMRALRGWAPDPALVDPSIPVDRGDPDRAGISMGYWPNYSMITPSARAGYLEWLQGGRRDSSAYIGYVFLFFYGIERRLLLDFGSGIVSSEESSGLLDEVRSLLEVYGHNGSFRGYASGFLDLVEIAQGRIDPESAKLVLSEDEWNVSARTRFVVGQFVANSRPIPAEWAYAWWKQSSRSAAPMPVRRCPEEFQSLFAIRYREKFGSGLTIPRNRTPLRIAYRPSSASFVDKIEIRFDDIPDVGALTNPVSRLQEIAAEVCDELAPYSRWVGRHEDRGSPAAIALLPKELAHRTAGDEARDILEWLEERLGRADHVVVQSRDLVDRWPAASIGKLTKKEAGALADFMGHFGFGVEPDVRFGGSNLSSVDHLAVFRSVEASIPPGANYPAAAVLLRFGAAMAGADEAVSREEEELMERHLEDALELEPHARERLRARLRWLLTDPPSLAGMKRKIERLESGQRVQAARFLLSVAAADGHVSPSEIKILSKVYRLFGFDPEGVYSDVHALASGSDIDRSGLVTVVEADRPEGAVIPPVPSAKTVHLDRERVDTIRRETREVGRILQAVFGEEEDASIVEPADTSIDGLDAAHANLVHLLLSRDVWLRSEFERLAEEHGLLPAGALETINDFSFDLVGEPLLEGDEEYAINAYAAEEVGK